MKPAPAPVLAPRKKPRQSRSGATVEAVFEATLQVLLAVGARKLTTTRVAERAGVSVGTLYQYFPNKQALLYAVLQRHLEEVAGAVEAACLRHRGQPLAAMAEGLVAAFVDAKTARPEISPALYAVAAELDTAGLLGGITRRVDLAIRGMLAGAADAAFDDLSAVVFTLHAAMAGTTRAVLEREPTAPRIAKLRAELTRLCRAYLEDAAAPKPQGSSRKRS